MAARRSGRCRRSGSGSGSRSPPPAPRCRAAPCGRAAARRASRCRAARTPRRGSPRDALQLLEHVQVGVVVDVGGVVALVGREHRQHHHDAGRLLVDHHALLHHRLRQLRRRLADAVLHVDLVDVRVAAGLEHHADRALPLEELVERNRSRLSMPLICASIGAATVLAMTSAVAPG